MRDPSSAIHGGGEKKYGKLFMKVFIGVSIVVLMIMMVYGPSLTGATTMTQCVEYDRYRDYRGNRRCIRYEDKIVDAKYNLSYYIGVPLFVGVFVALIVSCTVHPDSCRTYSYRDDRYYSRNSLDVGGVRLQF